MMFQVIAQFDINKNDDVNAVVYSNTLLHALLGKMRKNTLHFQFV